MIPTWMENLMNGLATDFYNILKNERIAQEAIEKYPDDSIESLAESLAEGYDSSSCGDISRKLNKLGFIPDYDVICKNAFKKAAIKALSEVTDKKEQGC